MKAADLESTTDVGRSSLTRVDAPVKVAGRARYSADVQLSGQPHARILRSPHPHARVIEVDTTHAKEMDGVLAVLTIDDVQDLEWYEEGAPCFADVVRFVGDEIAAVAAIDADTAQRAIDAIDVRYEVRSYVTRFTDAAEVAE